MNNLKYNENYNPKKHSELYVIVDWCHNVITFGKKSMTLFDDLDLADDYLEKEITKLSKSDYEKEVIKDDYSNDYEKWFEETKGEYCIVKCKEIFTNKNIVHDPFGFHRAINWDMIGSELKPTKEKDYYEIKELT